MIGVLIAGHGDFPEGLKRTAEGIAGPLQRILTLSFHNGEKRENLVQKMEQTLNELNSPQGILVLTDVFGGTASNICRFFGNRYKLRMVTGVNLPMLLELATHREIEDLRELSNRIEAVGKRSIMETCFQREKDG